VAIGNKALYPTGLAEEVDQIPNIEFFHQNPEFGNNIKA
jgi:hypothetical protein